MDAQYFLGRKDRHPVFKIVFLVLIYTQPI